MYCSKCGKFMDANDIFCSHCGNRSSCQNPNLSISSEGGVKYSGNIMTVLERLKYSSKTIESILGNYTSACQLAERILTDDEIIYFISPCFLNNDSFVRAVVAEVLLIITHRRVIVLSKRILSKQEISIDYKHITSIKKNLSWHSEYGNDIILKLEDNTNISIALFSQEAIDIAYTIILKKMRDEIIDSSMQLSYCPISPKKIVYKTNLKPFDKHAEKFKGIFMSEISKMKRNSRMFMPGDKAFDDHKGCEKHKLENHNMLNEEILFIFDDSVLGRGGNEGIIVTPFNIILKYGFVILPIKSIKDIKIIKDYSNNCYYWHFYTTAKEYKVLYIRRDTEFDKILLQAIREANSL